MQQIQTQLHALKLSGMAESLQQQREQPNTYTDLSFEERLAQLVSAEVTYRDNRRLTRLLRAAKLKLAATMSEIDYAHPRGLKKNVMASLSAGDWLNHYQNLIITGPCGSGKSYIACALGHHACLQAHLCHRLLTGNPALRAGTGGARWSLPALVVCQALGRLGGG